MSTFKFKNLTNCTDPEMVLGECIQKCVDYARDKALSEGNNATHVGVIIMSAELDYDMWCPVRRYTDDTVPSILHRFEYLNAYKENRLIESSFTVEVSVFDCDQMGEAARQDAGLEGQ
jgi:hypothetical protein